jgi:catechol 2,3-dioxygenase-like lactoylglutathione lyase family enzyme
MFGEIESVKGFTLLVKDQDRAKDFYVTKLDFEIRADAPIFPGASARWLAVAPKYDATEIILWPSEDNSLDENYFSRPQPLMFSVVGVMEVYGKLKSKGSLLFKK